MHQLLYCFSAALLYYKGREKFLLSLFFPHAVPCSQIVSTTSLYRVDQ
jgi:hypothetical protein